MYLEDLLNHLRFDMDLEKSAEVKLRLYGCGYEYEVDLTYNRLEKDADGNLIIIADDN